MTDLRFDHLAFLHLLWLVPLLLVVALWGRSRSEAALARFASPMMHQFLAPSRSKVRPAVKVGVLLMALTCLIVAASGPRYGTRWEEVPPKGIDIFVILDVSRSMLAEDVAPNRMQRAKLYIEDLVAKLPGDRVGLISFAGRASVTCPLTTNYGWFLMALDQVDTHASNVGGSSLGDAIRLAADSFLDRVQDHKAIVIFTDGEDQESYPVDAARAVYQERGIRVFTVGLGDANTGSRIPVEKDGQRVNLTFDGQEVWSKMNVGLLQETALAGGGAFVPAGIAAIDMGEIYETRIGDISSGELDSTGRIERHIPRFQWPAGVALILIIIETLVSESRSAKSQSVPDGPT